MQARFFLLPLLLNTTFIPQFFHEIGVGQCIRLFKPLCQQRNSRDFSKFTHQCSFDRHHVLNMVEKICKKKIVTLEQNYSWYTLELQFATTIIQAWLSQK